MATKYKLSYTAKEIDERLKRIDNFDLILELLDAAVYTSDKSSLISLLKQNLGIVEETPVDNNIYWTAGYGIANGVYQDGLLALNAGYKNRITAYQLSGDVPFYQNGVFATYDVYPITIPNGATTLAVTVPDGYIHGVMFWKLDGSSVTLVNDYGWNGNTFTYNMEDYKGATHITVNVKNNSNTEITYNGDFSDFSVIFDDAQTDKMSIIYVNGSVYSNNNVFAIYGHNARMSVATTKAVADTPFNQEPDYGFGDLYLLPVPKDMCVLNVTSLGFIGGPQFFTLSDGKYTQALDAGWQTADEFSYKFAANTYDFVAINFKNPDGTSFSVNDVDKSAFVIEFAKEEEIDVVISALVRGSTSFVDGSGLQIHRGNDITNMAHRATLMPTGQYLKNGSTYRFSIGDVASTYSFGVQIMQASTGGLVFDSTDGIETYHNTVTSRLVDTGWMTSDYEYTVTGDNQIFTMNFKINSGADFTTNDYTRLLASIVIEEVM